jgi:NitT/TauT family transport system substrate-binding protein
VPLFFEKYGLNFLEDGIYCLSAKTRSDPGLCWDFTEAVLESWMYAFDHPEETLDVVIRIAKKQSLPVNRSHQRWMLDCYRELYIPKGQHTINTVLRISDYLNVSRIMLQSKLIRNTVPYKDFFIPFRSLNPKAMKEKNEPAYAE